MYKKIMVPLDGSEYSECVLEHVKALATGCKVPEVVILYVAEPVFQGVYDIPENVIKDARQKREEFARQYVEKIARNLTEAGVTVKTAIERGKPTEAILDYAKANNVDLIVMSTHGRSGVSKFMLGSVADRVVRHAVQPVLLVTPPGCRIMMEAG